MKDHNVEMSNERIVKTSVERSAGCWPQVIGAKYARRGLEAASKISSCLLWLSVER